MVPPPRCPAPAEPSGDPSAWRRLLRTLPAVLAGAMLVAVAGCEDVERIAVRWTPPSPHAAYLAGLHEAGLENTALARDWVTQAADAVRDPQAVSLPFRETTFITPEEPRALGYRFTLERGRRVTIRLDVDSDDDTRVFLDFLRLAEDPDGLPRPVLTADTVAGALTYEPYRSGDYLVRVQPELLRGGTFTVEVALEAALAFPVEGHSTRAIQSFFGAVRDGGRRSHHGVDIFAPRGTPVLASRPGEVRRANLTNLGGKVVWLRDEAMRRNIYYAHLDSQVVARGDRVEVGDTLGFVGNTGNAITTPPHLHYGIYVRGEGPIDPLPYIREPRLRPPPLAIDPDLLGAWVRVRNEGIRLRSGPGRTAPVERELAAWTPMRVLGGNGSWLRTRLPDGADGYVAARLTEPVSSPVERITTASKVSLTADPRPDAPVVQVAPAGATLDVRGRFGDFVWVEGGAGRPAWARLDRGERGS